MLAALRFIAAGYREWDAGSWAILLGGFFFGLFGGLGYLLKIWKGDTNATFSPADVMLKLGSLTSTINQNSVVAAQANAKADDAHARLDLAGAPSANAVVGPEPQSITLPQKGP